MRWALLAVLAAMLLVTTRPRERWLAGHEVRWIGGFWSRHPDPPFRLWRHRNLSSAFAGVCAFVGGSLADTTAPTALVGLAAVAFAPFVHMSMLLIGAHFEQ